MRVCLVISLWSRIFSEKSPKEGGADGEIEGAHAFLALVQQLLQLVPALVGLGIHGDVEEPRAELFQFRLVEFARLQMFLEGVGRKLPVFVMRHFGAGRADDAGGLGKLAGHLTMVEGGKKLALCKVAGAAEDDIIERLNGNDLAAHEALSLGEWIEAHII